MRTVASRIKVLAKADFAPTQPCFNPASPGIGLRGDTVSATNRMPKMLGIVMASLLAMAATGTAVASPVIQNSVVSEDPVGYTPRVTTGVAVYKMLQVGPTMFAGGDFTQIQNSARTTTYNRNNLFSFDATTGAVTHLSRDLRPTLGLGHGHRRDLAVGGR